MPRYADIDALPMWDELFMKGKNDSGVWVRYRDVERLIRNAPTADVEEVKHGEWILEREPNGKPYCFHCSVCDDDFHYISIVTKYPYCPNCGAKMDKEENEDAEEVH